MSSVIKYLLTSLLILFCLSEVSCKESKFNLNASNESYIVEESSQKKYNTRVDELLDNSDLQLNEGGIYNGHTIDRHVDRDLDWLKSRLIRERRIKAATSYPNLEIANKVVKEIIYDNKLEIEQWATNSSAAHKEAFSTKFDNVIGYGLKRGEDQLKPCYKGVLVLTKIENEKLKILTSYPTE